MDDRAQPAAAVDTAAVGTYLRGLQDRIVAGLESLDGTPFLTDAWTRPEGGGGVMLDAALSKVAAWVATSTPEGHVATASPRHAKC